jgi:predicted CXXCH cytochrome family protein
VTPLSSSPYLNTGPDAHYVGSAKCRTCHKDAHQSYKDTGMGCSMAEVDVSREPPDAAFDHPVSKRRYQVQRKGGALWHRELLLTTGKEEVVLCEYPLKYVVGSGRHTRTYVAEVDGFLVESPVSWYASRKGWAMSPGYDQANHRGFWRDVSDNCLFCHAGQAEAVDRSLHRLRITEAAIGCERCHGPGSMHVERRNRSGGADPGTDYTIVNPARLPRDLAEAVCQQCHLRPTARIVARGRKPTDFRPGLPLQDVWHTYAPDTPDLAMTVVGHVEQLHLSRCYQSSKTLSCLTCHNPHDKPRPEQRVAYYNATCLKCHPAERCKVDKSRRDKESPGNNCVQCHMPHAPTDVLHVAFTHHRIAVHDKPPPADDGKAAPKLRPFLDLSRLSAIDRERSLGLAYLEAADRATHDEPRTVYLREARDLLSAVHDAGLRDSFVDSSRARLHAALGMGDVLVRAERALVNPDLEGQERCNALFLLADAKFRQGAHGEAIPALRELNRLRRHPTDWLLLAECERALGNETAAFEALETAVRIDPRLGRIHQYLAEHHRGLGNRERAAWHARRAVP